MRTIIVGAGEVGYHVAERLAREHHDVVVVDVDPTRLAYVETHLDVGVLLGSGTSAAVLEQAGIDRASLLLAVTSVDEVNLVCCMSADSRTDLTKVARVSNPDFYVDGGGPDARRFGIDMLINPERELAVEALRLLESTAASDIAVFAGGAVQLLGLTIVEGAPVADRTLAELGVETADRPFLTVALERNGEAMIPDGDTVLHEDDHVYVMTATSEIPEVLRLCGHQQTKLRRVIMAGASKEAYYLAQFLERYHIQGTILVDDPEKAQEFAEKLEKTLILLGDATEVELLELESVGEADAFLALTDDDEKNIISSLVARDLGTKQVITLVNKTDYLPLARRIGLEAAVSPRISAANAILSHVRRGSVSRVATLKESEAEVISFDVSENARILGIPLAAAEFPDHAIVAALVREGQVMVPRGTDALQVGDEAIVFALGDAIEAVTALFPS